MASTDFANRIWSPFEIKVILHHYGSMAKFDRCDAPIYPEIVERLKKCGVLEDHSYAASENENPYQTTALGNALVEMWCTQPLPVSRFVDPRFEEADRND